MRLFATILIAVILLSGAVGLIAARTYRGVLQHRAGSRKITIDHIFNGTFASERRSINWVPEGVFNLLRIIRLIQTRHVAGDGVYSLFEYGDLKLVDLKTNSTKVLVSSKDIKDVCLTPFAALDELQS